MRGRRARRQDRRLASAASDGERDPGPCAVVAAVTRAPLRRSDNPAAAHPEDEASRPDVGTALMHTDAGDEARGRNGHHLERVVHVYWDEAAARSVSAELRRERAELDDHLRTCLR